MMLLSDFIGLIGSVLLVVPALRASRFLKLIDSVKKLVAANRSDKHDPGPKVAAALESHISSWSRVDQFCLVAGLLLLAASFLIKLYMGYSTG